MCLDMSALSAREQGKLFFQKGKFSASAEAYTEAINEERDSAPLYQVCFTSASMDSVPLSPFCVCAEEGIFLSCIFACARFVVSRATSTALPEWYRR